MAVQLDDMNPGITLTGLFWTMAVPENSVDVDFGKGRAELRVENAEIEDLRAIVGRTHNIPEHSSKQFPAAGKRQR